MKLYASGEDYPEAVLIIERRQKAARSVDISDQLGVSKPSVSRAVSLLKEGGFLRTGNKLLHLADAGRKITEKIYERHCFFKHRLIDIGTDEKTAEKSKNRENHAVFPVFIISFQCFFADAFLWKNFTASTIGITITARSRATPYSVKPTGVKPKAFARNGISSTAVVSASEPIIATHRILFCPCRLKTDCR